MIDSLMRPREVLKYLNISRITLLKLIKKKKLPATKVGSQWRFNKEDIKDWLKKQEKNFSKR